MEEQKRKEKKQLLKIFDPDYPTSWRREKERKERK